MNDIKDFDLNELILLRENIDKEITQRTNFIQKEKWEKIKQIIKEYIEVDSIRIFYPNGTSFLDIVSEEDVDLLFAIPGTIELE